MEVYPSLVEPTHKRIALPDPVFRKQCFSVVVSPPVSFLIIELPSVLLFGHALYTHQFKCRPFSRAFVCALEVCVSDAYGIGYAVIERPDPLAELRTLPELPDGLPLDLTDSACCNAKLLPTLLQSVSGHIPHGQDLCFSFRKYLIYGRP